MSDALEDGQRSSWFNLNEHHVPATATSFEVVVFKLFKEQTCSLPSLRGWCPGRAHELALLTTILSQSCR